MGFIFDAKNRESPKARAFAEIVVHKGPEGLVPAMGRSGTAILQKRADVWRLLYNFSQSIQTMF